jgi:hypothetical protein
LYLKILSAVACISLLCACASPPSAAQISAENYKNCLVNNAENPERCAALGKVFEVDAAQQAIEQQQNAQRAAAMQAASNNLMVMGVYMMNAGAGR